MPQGQVPWVPTTPSRPILPTPVPIWTTGQGSQLCSHSNGVAAEPPALAHGNTRTRVPITFGDISTSSNSIVEFLTRADTSSSYASATYDGFLNQFVPAFNSEFNQAYSLLGHHLHLPCEQPFLNPIHNQYQDLQGTPYFAYYSKAFSQISPPSANAIRAETRKDAETQITKEERNQEGGEKNVSPTPEKNREVAAVCTPHGKNLSSQKEISHHFDLNKTPQPKPRRKKHRPKVIKEDKPKKTKQPSTGNPPTEKKARRKGSNTSSTPQTKEAEYPKSAKRMCRRPLNFDIEEQPRNDNSGRGITAVIEETQGLDNLVALQRDPRDWMIAQNYHKIPSTDSAWLHAVGSKRKQSVIQQSDNKSINLIGSQYNGVQAYSQMYCVQFPNVQKKKRSGKGRISNTSYPSSPTATKDAPLATCPQDARSHSYTPSPAFWTSAFEYNAVGVPVIYTATERAIYDKPQSLEYNLSLGQRMPTKRRSRVPTRKSDTKLARTRKQTSSSDRQTFGDAERPQTGIADLLFILSLDAVAADVACEEIWKKKDSVEAITQVFTHLNINGDALHGQNMLVPYQEKDGTMVPVKPKKHRAKAAIDEETRRVWKLLMVDINSPGIDGIDEASAKYWEEERNVFRGRADSFIARMHLVQGDRRFSKWKGSVVDSVVGVFLTQNVSDHLSSSAFMSLAARFPLNSSRGSTSLTVNEQVFIVEPEDEKLDQQKLDQSVCELNSMTIDIIEHSEEREAVDSNDSCRSTNSLTGITDITNSGLLESAQRHNSEHSPVESGSMSAMTQEGQENSCQKCVREELNYVFSSQSSALTPQISEDPSIEQNPEKIGSFSDSNSEIEELSSAAKFNISFTELLEMASSTVLHEVNSQRNKSIENFRDTYSPSIDIKHGNLVENMEKANDTQGSLEASTLKITPNTGVLEVNCYDPLNIEVPSSDSSKNKDENAKRSSFPESDNQAATVNTQGQTQDSMPKAIRKKKGKKNSVPAKSKKKQTKKRNEPKQKKEPIKEKNIDFDWDSLRIQAQAKAGKREKTENTMDSMDWEAVKRADINEIAGIIKARGMNNMLADRIKNFLDRLAEKHGGIDLEWLRDVPPDQAKEFLLSVTGLGLKSVECVRLLSLHQLAFPVDTNVGRIAVRLGWVPIQPLPESLQIHLLELYPVLDAVQKYLWPRLCKLDQKTLYELHYQLITFGKVFCTKNSPNCNACPMRGECRHFASAFASARLALPGPEQNGIVTTIGNNATVQNPPLVISQQPLLIHGNTNQEELQQTEVTRQPGGKYETNISQPIIEEPATPEQECSQVSENDIEDIFKEESGEIPTIKLDMEEFTLNLQNYMQENMELKEGEMSKAMVALHPEAACIPTPKLKNISRLRTEHYVYELPDSHPLLNGWEKREPDDPGKYLLAIWTPGETANSIEPPQRKCSSQEYGQLCNEKACFSCNSIREANSQIVRGTILIPCRTAMKGSFPLNGTYFQVNEVFADNDSSINPISVPRSWIWNLERRTVYFGTSVTSIFRGYVCVRGFDRETRAPRPLLARLHFKSNKGKGKGTGTGKGKGTGTGKGKGKGKSKEEPDSRKSKGKNKKQITEQPELLSKIANLQETGGP
ncbi:hypothetical protein Fmac_006463 [Flemingia macrophylla]|uniref:HhH-GPD domain-containing protein n=1 Tax=Flemingia macrophylla TaxID=520843 RepID=A0ABD1NAN3_9FABA